MARRAGDFWCPIQVQSPTVSRTSTGEISRSWSTVALWHAAVEDVSGGEDLRGRSVGAEVTHILRMRYMRQLSPNMRILHAGKTLEIVTVLDRNGKHVEHEVHCKEAVP